MKSKTLIIALFISACIAISAAARTKKWWHVYFTVPGTETAGNPRAGLIGCISGAKKSISGAFYDINDKKIADELIAAHKRGVSVRLVTETDNFHRPAVTRLVNAGIIVKGDNAKGLMHHKFAIFDNEILWSGSYNITYNGYFRNNNNAIKIFSTEISSIFLDEFNEMFVRGIFQNRQEKGPLSGIKKYYVRINGETDINVYFSPEDNIEEIILRRVKKAHASIHFMAFSFTSNTIGEAMIAKHKKGVRVHGIFEKKDTDQQYSEYIKMKLEGLDVMTDKNPHNMHHKTIIIDAKTVITGSYNFSKNANRNNDENIMIIESADMAKEYLAEFVRLKQAK